MQQSSPRRKLRIRWIAGGLCLLFVAWFCWQLFGPNPAIIVSKETTFITAPLAADGLPDYEAYLLEEGFRGVTPENNAAVLLWQAMWPGDLPQEDWLQLCSALGMEEVPSEREALVEPYDESVREKLAVELLQRFPDPTPAEKAIADSDTEGEYGGFGEYGLFGEYGDWKSRLTSETADLLIDEASTRPWTRKQIPVLAKWVEQSQKSLDLIVEAAARPRFYSPAPSILNASHDSLVSMLFSDIQLPRRVLRALSVRAMWHMGEGRLQEAWKVLLACHRLARLTAQGTFLVSQLVASAIDSITCNATSILLHHADIDREMAKQILADLNAMGENSNCARAIDQGERLWFLELGVSLKAGRYSLGDFHEYLDDTRALKLVHSSKSTGT